MRHRIIILMALALVAAACQIRFDTAVVINEDGSGTFAIEISVDEELRQLSEEGDGELDLTEGLADTPPAGWTAEEFENGGFEGVRISTDFTSIDDLNARLLDLAEISGEDGSPTDLFDGLEIRKDGNTFSFRAGAEGLSDSLLSEDDGGVFEGFDPSMIFESLFEIRLLVTLPGELGEHNADEVRGNTLIWNVGLDDEGAEFSATSTVGGGGLNPLVLVVLIIAAAAAIFMVLSRRKDETDISPESPEPVEPEAAE